MPTIDERQNYRTEIQSKSPDEIRNLLNKKELYAEWKRQILIERQEEIDNEKMLECAIKSNDLAEKAQKKAKWANIYAFISVLISIIALIISLLH
ncbi:hypothetical protein [Legionella maioricensis]|uniref:Uncharacterized protein n=1 Tax=Legionella maioricensis TaxID=2896528 RepID=A0A9X2IB72_9GAMM|nr:hypothetical protein [Legionella maioricensis]MCL9684200.1 hypothetical protein [Legionella maioricensis]MCL9687066.1 hypothetical protein [Legionella maioricensis]